MNAVTTTFIRVGGLVLTAEGKNITVGIVDDFGNVISVLDLDMRAASHAIANFT